MNKISPRAVPIPLVADRIGHVLIVPSDSVGLLVFATHLKVGWIMYPEDVIIVAPSVISDTNTFPYPKHIREGASVCSYSSLRFPELFCIHNTVVLCISGCDFLMN